MSSFKEKTRIFSRGTGDPFFSNFFDANDIEQIISRSINSQLKIEKEYLKELLNNAISFVSSFYPDINTKTPGKKDEIALLEALASIKKEEMELIELLLNQYGYKTFEHIKIVQNGDLLNTRRFLEEQCSKAKTLYYPLIFAQNNIKKKANKKTGPKSKQAVSSLIYQLTTVYELATQKSPAENFQQNNSTGTLSFKGEFYNFTRCVFDIVKMKDKHLEGYKLETMSKHKTLKSGVIYISIEPDNTEHFNYTVKFDKKTNKKGKILLKDIKNFTHQHPLTMKDLNPERLNILQLIANKGNIPSYNPFYLALNKESQALGKQIQTTIKLIKTEHKEAAKV